MCQQTSKSCSHRRWLFHAGAVLLAVLATSSAMAAESPPLTLQSKIPLGDVRGRIDHLAIDRARQRLFVAELGNNSVGVVDLKDQKVVHRIAGLSEPQGVAYVSAVDCIFVSNGGDGSLRVFSGSDFSPVARVELKADADNLRVDPIKNLVFAGFGSGGLAIIDAKSRKKVGEIGLKGHPEGFGLEPSGERVFVNVPDAKGIAVLDRTSSRQIATWTVTQATGNFPMAIRQRGTELLVGFRRPALLAIVDTRNGNLRAITPTCGDPDDIAVDEKRSRAYVSCGQGFIDVFQLGDAGVSRIDHIPTMAGARTALYDPELDRVFVAVKATSGTPAAIWFYKPQGP
jgi:DNA-binding beta-propeller fold protein YncE